MKIINTAEVAPDDLDPFTRHQIYNGLDCCITYEVLDALLPQLDECTSATYNFSRDLQGPALEMRLRGVRIDEARKEEVIEEYFGKLARLEEQLEYIVGEGCGLWQFNWRSNKDLKELFYDRLGIPPVRKQGRETVDRSALEKMEAYSVAKPIVRHLEAMRDIGKKIQVLKTAIDPDGRIRTSYNIGGTDTGRFSSSMSEFGTGSNLQNIEESLRRIFISDPGMKMAYFDGEQIQSRIVGAVEWNLFHDGKYLDACESGDLHTTVAKICWPDKGWTGDAEKDRAIAEQPFYRHHKLRHMCKMLGHGTNFDGKPHTMSIETKIEQDVIELFQPKYFIAFPAHIRWKEWMARQLIDFGYLIALTGRKRWFLDRRNEAGTVRKALAYEAQADEAFIVNTGMLKVWRANECRLMMQDHDAITVQYPEDQEDEIIPKILAQLRVRVQLKHGRELIIPFGCKSGWNKGEWSEDNPDGLKTWKGGDTRQRSAPMHVLDRPIRRVHR
jgi:DNA polymerase-1